MSRVLASFCLILAALFWGIGNVAQKTILEDLGPFTSFGLRSLIGLLVIVPLLPREARSRQKIGRSGWRAIGAAATLFCVALALQQLAYRDTSVTNASFFIGSTVVFTPLFAWVRLRERPRWATGPSIGLVLSGVWLMGGGLNGLSRGDHYCLISAILYSAWIVLVAEATRRLNRPIMLAAVQFTLAAVCGIALGLAFETISSDALTNAAPELFVLGVLSTGVAYTLQIAGQARVPATEAAIIMSAESLFGAVAAVVVLNEQIKGFAALGAGLILLAVLMIQLSPARTATARQGETGPPVNAPAP